MSSSEMPDPYPDETKAYKELVSKLAWAVGSTYKASYGKRTTIWAWACKMAGAIVEAHKKSTPPR